MSQGGLTALCLTVQRFFDYLVRPIPLDGLYSAGNPTSDVRTVFGDWEGFDAPICQDGRSGGFTELLARAEVSHDALIDFPSEKAFQASDDVPFRPSIRPASDDIVDRRLVIAHTDHDGSMEGGVRLSVAAPIEAVSTGGHPRGGGDGTRAAELGKGGFRANPVRCV